MPAEPRTTSYELRFPPAEIALRPPHVFQDLRLQRLRTFKPSLVADSFQKLDADITWRWPFERVQEEGLDAEAIIRPERRPVADVRDGAPLGRSAEIACSSNIYAGRWKDLRRRLQIQGRDCLLRSNAVSLYDLAFERVGAPQHAARARHIARLNARADLAA